MNKSRFLGSVFAVLLVGAVPARPQTARIAQGAAELQPCSGLSSLKVPLAPEHVDPVTHGLVSQDRLPMRVDIGRYTNLKRAVEGYLQTGVLLTAMNHGRLAPAGYDDDVAVFLFVSSAARWLHLGLNGAIYLVFLGIIGIVLTSGISGVFVLTRSFKERVLGVLVLITVVVIAYRLGGDIYMFPALVPVAIIPWAIYFATRGSARGFVIYAASAGFLLGLFRFLRIDSVIPALVLVVLLATFGPGRRLRLRTLGLAAMSTAFLLPGVLMSHLIHERDSYLRTEVSGYSGALGHHAVWHNVYIGLGFLSNPYVPGYCDQAAISVVEAAAPGTTYMSSAYESVLRAKVLELLKLHPKFVLYSLFSKAGVSLLVVMLAGNIGLITALRRPKPLLQEAAFWCATALSAVPGILAVPVPKYTTGLLAFTIMYSCYSIAYARGTLGPGAKESSDLELAAIGPRPKRRSELAAA
jgi:hypothetical protein